MRQFLIELPFSLKGEGKAQTKVLLVEFEY